MSSFNWTPEQQDAIYAKGGSLLVSAGAGSGKTAVLVQRVIEHITNENNPCSVDNLLVVTYTKAAAREMRERIRERLEELAASNDIHSDYYKDQLSRLSGAYISTVHSYCLELIKENFQLLDIEPGFRIADENELEILKSEALTHALDVMYDECTEDFKALANCFLNSKNDLGLQRAILKLYTFLNSHPFPEDWKNEQLSTYSEKDFFTKKQYVFMRENALETLDFCIELNDIIKAELKADPETDFTRDFPNGRDEKKIKALKKSPPLEIALYNSEILEKIRNAAEKDHDTFVSALKKFEKLSLYGNGLTCNQTYIKFKKYRDFINDNIMSLTGVFDRNSDDCIEDLSRGLPVVKELFRAVKLFENKYSELKNEKNIADFNDLEHYALKLLAKKDSRGNIIFTDIAKRTSEHFYEVMVDEYQDANEVQNMIFRAVSDNDKKLFTVGDVKQSIYRFRQAMPELFMKKSDNYTLYDRENPVFPAKIHLNRNFRSNKKILDAVNFVFSQLMSKKAGEIDYDTSEYLLTDRNDNEKSPSADYIMIDTSETDETNDVIEARKAAEIIKEEMANGFIISKNGDTVKPSYSDFCILLRKTSKQAATYVTELLNAGIPAVSAVKDSFFNCREINIIMSMLRVIDNPKQDIPLTAVMMSPLYGFTADDMAICRCNLKKGAIYDAVCLMAESETKFREFLDDIKHYRNMSSAMHTDELINLIYAEKSVYAIIGSMPGGENGINNLNYLREYASEYEKNGFKGLNGFIRFMDKLSESDKELTSATQIKGSATNAVSVMSIHMSKGLEFPICILGQLASAFKSDSGENMLINNEMGIGFKQSKTLRECRYSTFMHKTLSSFIKKSELSEELRILYVAMTRARDRMYFLHTCKNPAEKLYSAYSAVSGFEKIPYSLVLSTNNYADWLLMCMAKTYEGAKLIKKLYGADINCMPQNKGKWNISVIKYNGELFHSNEKESEPIAKAPDMMLYNELAERFQEKYPYTESTELAVKYSVSDLTKQDPDISGNMFNTRPDFMYAEGLTAAEKGTALHAYMQYCDFTAASKNALDELNRLVSLEYITPEQAQSVNLKLINNFFETDTAKKMLLSKKIYREYRFAVLLQLCDIISGANCNEKAVVQGAVDCAFEDDNGIVIVDYKTDNVSNMQKLLERYKEQLKLYKTAMQKCTGKPVYKLLIYSFKLNDYITVD
ncbi:MAG: helicase-exonuclease AddAB subunit AddA [Clostridiales bacterium]|nr:helicase-exonuclease AddAB subunit AddA [Clostridiales bacterium]